jgi:hypothetical protein
VNGTWAIGRWTLEEDAKLNSAVANTSNKKWGKEYKTDWPAVAALVPGRTNTQCMSRWVDALDSSIDRASRRKGKKWSAVEDNKLKDAVQRHGEKDWAAISALVPGRTRNQCGHRWRDVLNPSVALTAGRKGKWTEDEDSKLKDAVQTLGDKGWVEIAALVPGRTKMQCWNRWHYALKPSIALTAGRKGKWTAVEDGTLKDAVQMYGGMNWAAIAALVPGRTKTQCCNRWHDALDPRIALTGGSKGEWTGAEYSKLKDAVQTHGDKDWGAIAALVPGRTKNQCYQRWRDGLKPKTDRATGCTGT